MELTEKSVTSQLLSSCVGVDTIELGVSPAPARNTISITIHKPLAIVGSVMCVVLTAHLWYVVPVGNFTSGHAQASEKDTTRVAPAGTDVDAATAAPTDDPGFDAVVGVSPAWPNEPCCCRRSVGDSEDIIQSSEMDGCFYLLDLVPHVGRREAAGAGRANREGRADADTDAIRLLGCDRECHRRVPAGRPALASVSSQAPRFREVQEGSRRHGRSNTPVM